MYAHDYGNAFYHTTTRAMIRLEFLSSGQYAVDSLGLGKTLNVVEHSCIIVLKRFTNYFRMLKFNQ